VLAGMLVARVEPAIGDLLNPSLVEQSMQGINKLFLFLLHAIASEELKQALITYGTARWVGLKQITFPSVFKVEQFRDLRHLASKLAVASALCEFGVPYTILRPEGRTDGSGIYPMPIGTARICAVDIRDIPEAAAVSLTMDGHDGQTYDLVGPALNQRT
jgi:uncharacterized protein YbjT (DUF2867 family)